MMHGNILITFLLTTFLCFNVAWSQEGCNFPVRFIHPVIDEMDQKNTVIASLQHDPGTVDCSNSESFLFTEYVNFTDDGENITFFLCQDIGDFVDDNPNQSFEGTCSLTCPDIKQPSSLPVFITIIPENNKKPEFSRESVTLELVESMPVNLDFSYLLQNDDGSLLTVVDKDCPFQPNGTVNFEIDADNADRFQLLPPLQFPREICEGSIIYAPRISLKRRLSASEGNISFFLIAKDGGNPPLENQLPITIIVIPEDLRDPVFDYPYYSATIQNFEDVGLLNILPSKIHAKDGDVKIDEDIIYTIKDSGGLPLSIVSEGNEGININLTSPISPERDIAFVVIEANQTIQRWRGSTIVLVITLPSLMTTTSSTSTACPDTTTPTVLPAVTFEKSQYFSKIDANTTIGGKIITVNAISNDGESVYYSLDQTKKMFDIDQITGEIVVASTLTEGLYSCNAIALTANANDMAQVNVQVVKTPIGDDVTFEFPLYSFQVNEDHKPNSDPIGSVKLINGPSYSTNLSWTDPPTMQEYFSVNPDGSIVVRSSLAQLSGSHIHLNISATSDSPIGNSSTINTIVLIEVIDVNEPPIFETTTLIIGYPSRTYIDSLVAMPIFTVQATDHDIGDNGHLIYYLDDTENKSTSHFDIDSDKGTLYFKGISSLAEEYSIIIWVKDKPGLVSENSLNIKVRKLNEDEILVMNIKGGEELQDETINSDLRRILGYEQVVILHKESTFSPTSESSFSHSYTTNLYAVKNQTFVNKDVIFQDIKKHQEENPDIFSSLTWLPNVNNIFDPPSYEPVTTEQRLTSTINNLTVSVSVVGSLSGVVICFVIFFIINLYGCKKLHIYRRTSINKPDKPDESNKQRDSNNMGTPLTTISGSRDPPLANENVEKQKPNEKTDDYTSCDKEASDTDLPQYLPSLPKSILTVVNNERQYTSQVQNKESSEKKEEKSLELEKSSNDKKSYPPSPSAKKLFFSDTNDKKQESSGRNDGDKHVKLGKPIDAKNLQVEVYCPPSPGPQKSILKKNELSGSESPANPAKIIEEKKEKDGGVKFNPTPEVISVASSGSVQWISEAPVGSISVKTDEENEDIEMEAL